MAEQTAPVELRLSVDGPAEEGAARVSLAIRLAEEGNETSRTLSDETIVAPGAGSIAFPVGRWLLSASAPGLWAEETAVDVGADGGAVAIRMRRTAVVRVRVSVPESRDRPPDALTVRFSPSPEVPLALDLPKGEVSCPLRGEEWKCSIPAGEMDLMIRARGHVSHYFWGVALAVGAERDLGAIVLRPGASLTGWLEMEDGSSVDRESARLYLAPVFLGPAESEDEKRRRRALLRAESPNDRGFFHFESLPPGSYRLEARRPGFAPVWHTVKILENAEARLRETIVLSRQRTLEVSLSPPRDPWGTPWQVEVHGLSGSHSGIGQRGSFVQGSGTWRWTDLARGSYRVAVRTNGEARPNETSSWAYRDVELRAPTTTIDVEVPSLAVDGTVKLGKKGLAAALTFTGDSIPASIHVSASEDGTFRGFLPRTGRWSVTVRATDPPVERLLNGVEVQTRAGSDVAFVDLRLPGTSIVGSVVDEKGGPGPPETIITVLKDQGSDGGEAPEFVQHVAKVLRRHGVEGAGFLKRAELRRPLGAP